MWIMVLNDYDIKADGHVFKEIEKEEFHCK